MTTTPNDESEVARLRFEVAEMRAQLERLTSGNAELTVRRLAVSDGLGERIVLFADTMGEARVDVMLAPESRTTASLFAEPSDAGATVGVAVWTEGDHRASLSAVDTCQPYDDRRNVWVGDLSIVHSPERYVTTSVSVTHEGTQTNRSDLRGVDLPTRRREDEDGTP